MTKENSYLDFDGKLQETMLGPLWARAKCSQKYPKFFYDKEAIEIIDQIDYDFKKIKEYLDEWRSLGLVERARNFDAKAKQYLETHPEATIINLGSGLDTSFSRIDNGKIKMYNIDLPKPIEFRRKLIQDSLRNQTIPKSIFEYSWFSDIDFNQDDGIFFIAGGLIYYFEEKKISNLFSKLAQNFPRGEVVFDTISSLALKKVNKKAEKTKSNLRFKLAIDNPNELISKWSEKIESVESNTLWRGTKSESEWKLKTKVMIWISKKLKTAQIVHLKFAKK